MKIEKKVVNRFSFAGRESMEEALSTGDVLTAANIFKEEMEGYAGVGELFVERNQIFAKVIMACQKRSDAVEFFEEKFADKAGSLTIWTFDEDGEEDS